MNRVLFSKKSEHWATPKDLYKDLDKEFKFDFDPCPLHSEQDGLSKTWAGKRVFCNPPYGPKIKEFLNHATEADLAVFLIPARTDTKWFHTLVLPLAKEIRFLRGRLKFGDSKNSAPFPSMLVIYKKEDTTI